MDAKIKQLTIIKAFKNGIDCIFQSENSIQNESEREEVLSKNLNIN